MINYFMLSNFILLLLLILILLWLKCKYIQSQSVEPFTRKFFNQIQPTVLFALDPTQLYSNDRQFITLVKSFIDFPIQTRVGESMLDCYNLLNNNKVQLLLSQTNSLNLISNKIIENSPDISNVRFICTLFEVPVSIITSNPLWSQLDDLKGSQATVNVGRKYSGTYFLFLDLCTYYNLVIGQDIYLSYLDTPELLTAYANNQSKTQIQVAVLINTHPDSTIAKLCELKKSKFLELKKINNGELNISFTEQPFYKTFPYYNKRSIFKQTLKSYYNDLFTDKREFNQSSTQTPQIVGQSVDQNPFIDTISIKYYLLGNKFTNPDLIEQILFQMKLNLNQINQLNFIDPHIDNATFPDFTLNIPIQSGASRFYYKTGQYTQLSNPNCQLLDSKCTNEDLYRHKLFID